MFLLLSFFNFLPQFPRREWQWHGSQQYKFQVLPVLSRCVPFLISPSHRKRLRMKAQCCMRLWISNMPMSTSEGSLDRRVWMASYGHHERWRAQILVSKPLICRWCSIWTYSTQQPTDFGITGSLAIEYFHHPPGITPLQVEEFLWRIVRPLQINHSSADQLSSF